MTLAAKKSAFHVATLVFEGPMDLLLQLIERAELEVTSVAIAQVTNQFLEHIRSLQSVAAEEVSGFLVVAARLVQIKSEALLPRPPIREPGEENPAEELARQLVAYKRYKEIANLLHEREAIGMRTYLRTAAPQRADSTADLTDVTLAGLWSAALEVFSASGDNGEPLDSVVSRPKVTIRQKIRGIVQRIRTFGLARFSEILGETRSRIDVVVTFLAMLELVKQRRVAVNQNVLFGDIDITPAEDWDEATDFELEFGE